MTPLEAIVIGLGPFVLFSIALLVFGMTAMHRIAHGSKV